MSTPDASPEIKKYIRKPMQVEALQVTDDNMEFAATWSGGTIKTTKGTEERPPQRYVKIEMKRAISERHTRAFPGDWLLKSEVAVKVFTDPAFKASFDEILEVVS